MKIYSKILILLISISISACSWLFYPYNFTLNYEGKGSHTIYGYNMSKLGNIDIYAENALKMKENTTVALALRNQTIFEADFTISLSKGNSIDLSFRTVSDKYDTQSKLTLKIMEQGIALLENNKQVGELKEIKVGNEPIKIKIQNEGKIVKILADCAEIYKYRTELPLTEYMIFRTDAHTRADISGIKFVDIPN